MMKTALIIVSMALVGISILLVVKWRKWAVNEAQVDRFEIHPGPISLNKSVLGELGFKIYETKDKVYALNATGVSMTWIENSQWVVEILEGRTRYNATVTTVHELIEFASVYGKAIDVKAEN